jgi:hypothetical protein
VLAQVDERRALVGELDLRRPCLAALLADVNRDVETRQPRRSVVV